MVVAPLAMVPPHGSAQGQAAGAHDALVNEPESVPLVQTRASDAAAQEAPQATVLAEYATVLVSLATVAPHGSAQGAHAVAEHEELAYVPESTPAVQVRVSTRGAQEAPQATDAAE